VTESRAEPAVVRLSRRTLLRTGLVAGGAVGASRLLWPPGRRGPLLSDAWLRAPNSLPYPTELPGTANPAMPFDHIVVLMMENHSFDNFLGDLSKTRSDVVGPFNSTGAPAGGWPSYSNGVYVNSDGNGNQIEPYHMDTTCDPGGVDQSWDCTHGSMYWAYGSQPSSEYSTGSYNPASFGWSQPLSQVPLRPRNMAGFVIANGDVDPMGYWTAAEIPFTHSMAQAFTIANYWFCSAPCQTYPNRRFLMSGTAFGDISTDIDTIFDPSNGADAIAAPPPNGTIFDRLTAYDISWANFFTDLPATGIIPATIEKYPEHIQPVANFFAACAAGTLPAVSFVDPEFGVVTEVGSGIASIPGIGSLAQVQDLNNFMQTVNGDEEPPADVAYGEQFVAQVVNAVMHSPAWSRTLLVWTFDEHGGFADHVPVPAAIPPDGILPDVGSGDFYGAYDVYGPRVATVVVSPYSKPGGVSNMVYDHTSVLATIEHKWKLPACTYRDANANTVMDFLQDTPELLVPPVLAEPGPPLPGGLNCSSVLPAPVPSP